MPDDVKKIAADFVKKCPMENNDKGQVESKLRPKEVKEKIPITRRVIMHGAVALLLFESRKIVDPKSSERVEGHFNQTKHKISEKLGYDGEISPCEYWQALLKNQTNDKGMSL